MGSRVKEDERNERIIRGLLKLPENRRCINCNSLGPQYVCTNFWTFVCTTCSGIHREFTHRVKSVSMAKFTSQEVKALQEGGNQRSKQIYLKEWDPQRNSLPDSSNVERLRDFIKHVYVDKRYSGDRNLDKPPRTKTEDSYENRRTDSYQGGSRSPPYEDIERRSSAKSSPGKSPARPEVVNDWRREDRFGNGKRHEERRMSEGDLKLEGKSPDLGSSSPPVVRPVREILGENVIPLRIIEPPKPTPRTSSEGFAHTQRTASSSSLGSVEAKVEPSVSLIDFDADPEPPQQPTVAQPKPQQTTSQPADSTNWASFDAFPQAKVSQTPNLNPMESLLSGLSAPSQTPVVSVNNFSTFPLDGVSMAVPGPVNVQQPPSLIPATGQQFIPSNMGHANNQQPWNSSPAPNAPQGFPSNFTAQTNPSALRPAVASEPPPPASSDTRLSGRQALPEDLFAINYSAYRAPVPGWQTGPPPGTMVYPLHYHPVMPVQNFQQPSKSTNPFDMSGEAPPVQAPPQSFPSMGPLQGALPNMLNPSNMPPSGLTGFGAPTSAWMPQNSALPPAYASQIPPRAYMGQQVPDNRLPSGHHHQGLGGSVPEGPAFGFLNAEQQLHGRYSAPATPNPFPPSGGNPFG